MMHRLAIVAAGLVGVAVGLAQDQPGGPAGAGRGAGGVAAVGGGGGIGGGGAVGIGAGQGLNPEDFYGKDSNQGVYVRDSAVALERLALAQRMERLKEWGKSADVYQEILEKFPDRVVPSQVDKKNTVVQYTSVGMAVQERLARWPVEGLNVYRARYETEASAILQKAGGIGGAGAGGAADYAALNQVCTLYFVTDSGKTAAIRLIELYLEAGEFPAAAWVGERLLGWHPNLVVERPKVLYRTAMAYHLAGDEAAAKLKAEELKSKFADATGVVFGKDVLLAEAIEAAMQSPAPRAGAMTGDSWTTYGGTPHKGRISPAKGRPGTKFYQVNLNQPNYRAISALMRQRGMERDDRPRPAPLGVMPVTDRGELFFQDNSKVYAVSVETGLPLPGWAATYPGDQGGAYATGQQFPPMPAGTPLTLTVTDESVLAVITTTDRMNFNGQDRQTQLVCLDRRTGAKKWTMSPRDLPKEAGAAQGLDLTGTPLAVGDSVYVVGRGGKGMQFEDCYVMSVNGGTGKYRWSCYVASANAGMQYGDGDALPGENVPQLAYAGGRLYALTNLGAIAALDAYRGTILWLDIYPRGAAETPNSDVINIRNRFAGNVGASNAKQWAYNPVIVQGRRVFSLPTDSACVSIYDAGSGTSVATIDLPLVARRYLTGPNGETPDKLDTLLGVVDDKLVLAGDRSIVFLDWTKYDAANFGGEGRRDEPSVAWVRKDLSAVRGRGFVTTDSLFLPTENYLARLSLRTGKVEETYPRQSQHWGENEGPGNVLVTQDHVIIAGGKRVDGYTDTALAQRKLDLSVETNPTDPDARLRYAEVMFVGGRYDVAFGKLDEAIDLLGGLANLRPGMGRDRIFNDALAFAQRIAREGKPESTAMAGQLFDRAGAAAGNPSQHVTYRLVRAKFAATSRDYASVARLYQEILFDDALGLVMVPDEATGMMSQAGTVAENAIRDLIKVAGNECYEPFEKRALSELQGAQRKRDATKLLAVATRFPNARVAPQAMMEAADAFESSNNARQAVQVLRQIYRKYPSRRTQTVGVISAMARNYLRLPNRVDAAIARLTRGAKDYPDAKLDKPLTLPNGETISGVTFAQAAAALKKYDSQAAAKALADFRIPSATPVEPGQPHKKVVPFLAETPESMINDVAALVPPVATASRNDRVVTWNPTAGAAVYAVGSTTPAFVCPAINETPIGAAWYANNLVIWSAGRVAMIQGDNGKLIWRLDVKDLSPMDVVAGGKGDDDKDEPGEDAAPKPMGIGGRVIIQNGRRLFLGGRRVMALPAQQRPPAAGTEQVVHVEPLSDRLILTTSIGRLLAVDTTEGRPVWQTRLTDRPMDRLVANDDFTAVKITDDTTSQLAWIDTFTGQLLGRRVFKTEEGTIPINLALSADGRLVYTLPDRVCIKDLFEPGNEPTVQEPPNPTNSWPYAGADQPDHLLIADGTIVAVTSGATGDNPEGARDATKFVRLMSLEDGKIRKYVYPEGREFEAKLPTDIKDWNVRVRVAGRRIYVVGPKSLFSYDLEDRNLNRPLNVDATRGTPNFRDALPVKDYLVVIDQPVETRPGRVVTPNYRLHLYRRAETSQNRDGYLEHQFTIPTPNDLTRWQGVDGGLYYLTADQKLHYLKGARE